MGEREIEVETQALKPHADIVNRCDRWTIAAGLKPCAHIIAAIAISQKELSDQNDCMETVRSSIVASSLQSKLTFSKCYFIIQNLLWNFFNFKTIVRLN